MTSQHFKSDGRRTKIVCTIGPASRSPTGIANLIRAGMNVARLNFSHGTHAEHAEVIASIRAAAKRLGAYVAIMQDLSGPKMRIGQVPDDRMELKAGQRLTLTAHAAPASSNSVSVNYPDLIKVAEIQQRILLGDGLIQLKVVAKTADALECKVQHGGWLASRQGVNAPGIVLPEGVPTAKDRADLAFGLRHGVDWTAQSFVSTADELRDLRRAIRDAGGDTPIIAKIERRAALRNLDAIAAEADALMIARGDLGLEIGLEQVPFAQKQIIRAAGLAGKPEITATQMLESMIVQPRPTRAEVNDVANAVMDGSDAVMLSGETAVGANPAAACRAMAKIAAAAEKHLDYQADLSAKSFSADACACAAIAYAACWTASATRAKIIICCTRSGLTARLIARHRPQTPMAVVSPFESTLRRSMLYWGAYPVQIEMADNTDQMIALARNAVLQAGLAKRGDKAIIAAGIPVDQPGRTNMIKADIL
ncbi:MAG: pyruvate kinase [Kiritimatiellia bacterium]|jgi:pyruvate kinase